MASNLIGWAGASGLTMQAALLVERIKAKPIVTGEGGLTAISNAVSGFCVVPDSLGNGLGALLCPVI